MGISLSDAELTEFMAAEPTAILCIPRAGKAPLPVPMSFIWHEGKVYMRTASHSKKMAWLRGSPLVSVVVENSGAHYYELKAVLVMGTCTVEEHPARLEWYAELRNRVKPLYTDRDADELPPHLQRHYARPRALLTVTPHSVTSWDFRKIRR